jgi:serine/threonine protein kinase
MICAHCGSETAEAPCSGCARSPLLGGRYRLLARVAETDDQRTYQGEDSRSSGAVLLRRIDVRRVDADDLARRLNAHLAPVFRIHHPGLPRRRRCETTAGAVWIVRQWVSGPSLAERIAAGGALPLGEAIDIAERVLESLELLHAQTPAFPHGSLRASQVRLDAKGRPVLLGRMGTRPLLADPGHPQRALRESPTGLAPEQRSGDASPGADLYAVGALLTAMLAGRPAAQLERGGRIAWEQAVALPTGLGRWLDRMVDPAAGRRPATARIAREELAAARGAIDPAQLGTTAPAAKHIADDELPTTVVQAELPTTVMRSPVSLDRGTRDRGARDRGPQETRRWPDPEATPTSSGRRPAPADLAPTSIGRRPRAADIAEAEPTTVGRRPTAMELAEAEPTTVGRRPTRSEIAEAAPTSIARRPDLPEAAPTTIGRRPANLAPPSDPPTSSGRRPGPNPFDPPTGFARRASEIEHTGPRPPTLVRPPSAQKKGSAFDNPVFIAVGLAILGVALWQVVSRLTG